MRQPHAQHAALVQKPHAAHRLDGVVVAGPDKHVLRRKALGEIIGMVALKREGHCGHPAVQGVGRSQPANGQALHPAQTVNQLQGELVFVSHQPVPGG